MKKGKKNEQDLNSVITKFTEQEPSAKGEKKNFFKSLFTSLKNVSKKTWIKIGCGVGVVAVGIVGGFFIYNSFFSFSGKEYSIDAVKEYEDDQKQLMKRYEEGKSLEEYKNEFTPYELVNISLNNKMNQEKTTTLQKGLVDVMGISQTIRSATLKDGDSYCMENISKSNMVQVAKRFYGDNRNTKTYVGDCLDIDKAHYDDFTTCSNKEFENIMGKEISYPCVYTVSSKTVLESKVDISNGELVIVLDLDPAISIIRYVYQMIAISNLPSGPEFSKVHLEFHINNKMLVTRMEVEEAYKVLPPKDIPLEIASKANAILREETFYGECDIPALNTSIDYERVVLE